MRHSQSRAQIDIRMVAALLLFFAAVVHFVMVIPAFEGPDEPLHFGYVTTIRQAGNLPTPAKDHLGLAQHERGQPPLYYLYAWAWSWLGPDYQWDDGDLPDNPWIWNDTSWHIPDNRNRYMFGANQIPYTANLHLEPALLWMRFASVFEGILAVALVSASARRLLARCWARLAVILFAFNPMVIHSFALVGNDSAAILMGTLCTYVLIRLAQDSRAPSGVILSGGLVGLALLAKASLLAFVPVMATVILVRADGFRAGIQTLTRFMGSVLLTGGLWYLMNAIRFNDPFGLQPHLEMEWAFNGQRSLLSLFNGELRLALFNLWGMFGGMGRITPQSWYYAIPICIIGLGATGYIRGGRRLRVDGPVVLALTGVCLILMMAFLRWMMSFTTVGGRLLLPGYAALVLLVTLGLARGWQPRTGQLVGYLCAGFTMLLSLCVGWLTLPLAYGVILRPFDQLPPLEGPELEFGEVIFVGYRLISEPSSELKFQLCWGTHREGEPLPVPDPFFLVIADGGKIIGRRDSFTGMGTYTYWQPGRAFCDRVIVPLDEPMRPRREYTIHVRLFDRTTNYPLPENNGLGSAVGTIRID